MTYQILIGKSKAAPVEIHLDGRNPTAVPPKVFLGVGDKKKRYKEHLGKCFQENTPLLKYLAHMHKVGKEKGDITLVCQCKMKAFHALAVKEFLEENRETIEAVLPYLFTEAGFKTPEAPAEMVPLGSANSPRLSEQDMIEIRRLIAEDQAREAQDVA